MMDEQEVRFFMAEKRHSRNVTEGCDEIFDAGS